MKEKLDSRLLIKCIALLFNDEGTFFSRLPLLRSSYPLMKLILTPYTPFVLSTTKLLFIEPYMFAGTLSLANRFSDSILSIKEDFFADALLFSYFPTKFSGVLNSNLFIYSFFIGAMIVFLLISLPWLY